MKEEPHQEHRGDSLKGLSSNTANPEGDKLPIDKAEPPAAVDPTSGWRRDNTSNPEGDGIPNK